MSSLIIKGDTSGAITLSAPNAAGDSTYTLPAVNGSVMVSGNMPAFFAYKNGVPQSITNATFTKITFNAFDYNTAGSMFSSSTFTPTIAGYYQISAGISNLAGNTPTRTIVSIFKNGSGYAGFGDYTNSSSYRTYGSVLVYCNGTTDYIELYAYLAGSSLSVDYGQSTGVGYNTYMSGVLVRAA
jgi:hypothetical protein